MACTMKLSRGTQTSQMNMTTLQIEMNMDNTEITTLKSVTLFLISWSIIGVSRMGRGAGSLQCTPRQRRMHRSVVRIRIQYLDRITVPPVVGPFLPQQRAVQIRRRDAEQCQRGHCKRQLDDKEGSERFRMAPFSRHGREPGWDADAHRGAGVRERRAQLRYRSNTAIPLRALLSQADVESWSSTKWYRGDG